NLHPPGADTGRRCFLPERIKLDWVREQLVLDVTMRDVAINQFDPSLSAGMFVEPEMPGYTRRNLAELSRGPHRERRTTVRQTFPPPQPRNGVRLGRPTPLPDDAAEVPKLGQRAVPTSPGRAAMTPWEEVVGAPIPTAPIPKPIQAASALGVGADAYQFER